ncbi:putative nucleotidyltransferase substrate binding domain-containing protein [Colwelliaceae bacterium 6471]
MDAALAEIYTFVHEIPPFDALPESIVEQLVQDISISYVRKEQTLPPEDIDTPSLYILRKGALTYLAPDRELLGKYGEGDLCTEFCALGTEESQISVHTDEDTLLYSIPYEKLIKTLEDFPDTISFFTLTSEQRLSKRMSLISEEAVVASSLTNTTVSDFYHTPVATITHSSSIQDAAIMMTELNISCLVVMENNHHVGIVTDKDMRKRCVAAGLSIQQPVSTIMTREVATLDIKSNAYDALMVMTSKNIHHLPITKDMELAGIVTITDLMNHEGSNAINFTSIIHKARSIRELAEISRLLAKLQIRQAKLGTSADNVAKSISAVTMAFTIRLIEMAENLLGPAPVPYAWLAAGSQARQEQLAHSDQDNALIISNDMKPEDNFWFHDFSTFVCDGLAACGFIYCPGNIMATNSKWRQTQSTWMKYFSRWVDTPDTKALLYCSVFFDLETVYGDPSLLKEVRANMLQKTQKSTLFIAHLTKNALNLRPPLGFFRDFVLIQNGKHKATLDLKHNGIAPIVDLARIYALSEGISAVNTIERLQKCAGTSSLTKASAANLIDAFEFLNMLRMQHQAKQLQAMEKPDNYLSPKALSKLERQHLKDAFKVIKTLQDNRQAAF